MTTTLLGIESEVINALVNELTSGLLPTRVRVTRGVWEEFAAAADSRSDQATRTPRRDRMAMHYGFGSVVVEVDEKLDPRVRFEIDVAEEGEGL